GDMILVSDWSSDVCSSDLPVALGVPRIVTIFSWSQMVSWVPLVSIRYARVPRFSLYLTSLPTTTGCSSAGRALMSLATPVSSSLDLNCSLMPPLSASTRFSTVALNTPAYASAETNPTSYLLSPVPLWACHSLPP